MPDQSISIGVKFGLLIYTHKLSVYSRNIALSTSKSRENKIRISTYASSLTASYLCSAGRCFFTGARRQSYVFPNYQQATAAS